MVIKGGIYSRKIKAEPDVNVIATTQHIGENYLQYPTTSDSTETTHHLEYKIHRGVEQDSIIDIFMRRVVIHL